jgi:hypothetical protein
MFTVLGTKEGVRNLEKGNNGDDCVVFSPEINK